METPKYNSENVVQAEFDKTFSAFANHSGLITNGMQLNSAGQNNESFIQSLSETRNIMSQFAIPTANGNTVNVGEFQSMLNMQNLKASVVAQTSLPLNINYGLVNPQYAGSVQQGLAQSFQNKSEPNGDQQPLSQDCKPTLVPFQGQVMQAMNAAPSGNTQVKPEPFNVLSQIKLENAIGQEGFTTNVLKSESVTPLTDSTTNINANTSVMCDICGKICKDSGKLKMHKLTHTKDKPFKCDVCFKSFSTNFKLKAHIHIHGNEKPHHCPVCNKAFHSKTYVDRHMVVHSSEKPHRCETCDKAFGRKEHLKRHLLTHSGEKPHKCTLCEKSFRCKSNLITHVLKHSNPDYANTNDNNSTNSNNAPAKRRPRQQHHCTLCNAVFSTKSSFNAHVLEHTGRKPYQCDKCDKCFNDKSSLCRHNMVHTGEKPYQCSHCEKCFARRDHLQRHTLTHTGEKPHQCKLCPKWFKLKRDLNAHIETHKENQPTEGGNTTDNQESKSATPNSQVSTDPGSITTSSVQQPNPMPAAPIAIVQAAPLGQTPAPLSATSVAQPIPQIQVPIPQLPMNTIPAHILPNLPQPPPGHIIMNTHPISQLLNQLNMQQQLQNGQIAVNPAQSNQIPIRPVLGNGLTVNQPQSINLPANQVPASQALINNFFGAQPNAVGQFTLPAISSVMAPQNNAIAPNFQPQNVKVESGTENTFAQPNKSENTAASTPYEMTIKSEAVTTTAPFATVKDENVSYLPAITANNNIINLGLSLPVNPVTTANDIYTTSAPQKATTDGDLYVPTQKATTDGGIYVENINQINQDYGVHVKSESVAQNGVYGQDETMTNVDHSSLITNAMNSLNTINNCQLSA